MFKYNFHVLDIVFVGKCERASTRFQELEIQNSSARTWNIKKVRKDK